MSPISQAGEGARRLTKNEKRRLKKKSAKAESTVADASSGKSIKVKSEDENDLNVQVEYVSADVQSMVQEDPAMAQFQEIFEKFSSSSQVTGPSEEELAKKAAEEENQKKKEAPEEEKVKTLSKKKKKLLSRLSVAELKQLVQRPDVVEAHDVTAADPRLLVYLKAYRNTVPVPRHWCHKRKYLQGKRGMEKAPFQLPGTTS